MRPLRDCSISYSFPQARALLAASMMRELTNDALLSLAVSLGSAFPSERISTRALAWTVAAGLLPPGSETRKKRRAPLPKQRRLPGTE